jgi:glycosyltransferase involved in cell wall biosynthesis
MANFLEQVTPLIITYNEEANIGRTLSKLAWANKILVVDSGSTDATLNIARSFGNVEIKHRKFDDFASQCNFGLENVPTAWVLSLDADYELSNELVAELKDLRPDEATWGYQSDFIYRIYGKPLRASVYPPRIVLHRKLGACYHNEGHAHRVAVDGHIVKLQNPIFHDDRKTLARWFSSQQRYALLEAEHLASADRAALSTVDRIRQASWPGPLLALPYVLLIKGCLFDGWAGWFYALQRLVAETMISIAIVAARLEARRK